MTWSTANAKTDQVSREIQDQFISLAIEINKKLGQNTDKEHRRLADFLITAINIGIKMREIAEGGNK